MKLLGLCPFALHRRDGSYAPDLMSSTPPTRTLDLAERPSSPALASPRRAAPSLNPFAPVLPPKGTRAPLVRLRRDQHPSAGEGGDVTGAPPELMSGFGGRDGQLEMDPDDSSSVGDADESGARSAFMPSTRSTNRQRPVVRQGYQVRRREEAAQVVEFGDRTSTVKLTVPPFGSTMALGRELGALDIAKEHLGVVTRQSGDAAAPKENAESPAARATVLQTDGSAQAKAETDQEEADRAREEGMQVH